ncbi:hypothetical protein QR680_014600 [Steinernema hermaphroditum]|uniref:Uncharacterized protein n=1 Tax=Steinernema hermaphroditum TaxID=289476 RepID=A0AA39IBN9_9BILA|nr:hypothetical protein QR680_014600 [Steinernema hermaphroditum]
MRRSLLSFALAFFVGSATAVWDEPTPVSHLTRKPVTWGDKNYGQWCRNYETNVHRQCPEASFAHWYTCCGPDRTECCFGIQPWVYVIAGAILAVAFITTIFYTLLQMNLVFPQQKEKHADTAEGYQCIDHLQNKPSDYGIVDEDEPILLHMVNKDCGNKPACICVKANQLFVTEEFDEICYPYASICAALSRYSDAPFPEDGGHFNDSPLTYYIDIPTTFNASKTEHHVLKLRKAGLIEYQEVTKADWAKNVWAAQKNKPKSYKHYTLAVQLGPLITTTGYVEGEKKPRTIVRMWQPTSSKLCSEAIKVNNLLEGHFYMDPMV